MGVPEIAFLPPSAADDLELVGALAELVNLVYAKAEAGLWAGAVDRTDVAEMAALVRAGEIAVARLDGAVVGSVRVQRLSAELGEFGLLAAAPEVRGAGIGRSLVRFAEEHSRAAGCVRMQLELLVPRNGTHPAKQFLSDWYRRLGYRVVEVAAFDGPHPDLARLLAVRCDFLIWHKELA
ncbi:GNAT family N-acetyltransferase [Amycolatopsis benzoatilytica]|uniref:GNAT family N-acetyltransferase n=1 Tax=Amycolatopsis benzoatilytica TaxID=346045 RepID=UPI00036BCA0E|nr:GNAT family N-acetyltransferase [Amycolatopsis benzoatilytica]